MDDTLASHGFPWFAIVLHEFSWISDFSHDFPTVLVCSNALPKRLWGIVETSSLVTAGGSLWDLTVFQLPNGFPTVSGSMGSRPVLHMLILFDWYTIDDRVTDSASHRRSSSMLSYRC